MDSEQSKNFNERLSQWIGNQGFWFQVRYSMTSSGVKGQAMIHLLRMGFRLLVFFVLVALASWGYLVKRADSARFRSGLQAGLQAGLAVSKLEMKGGQRSRGQLEISRFAANGGPASFFTNIEVTNLRCKMDLLDGLVGVWKPGNIAIAKLDLNLRAGADDAGVAQQLAAAIFNKPPAIQLNSFEVADATLRWGYSAQTVGGIESSQLKMQRTETGWRLNFKGGWFHQNWLRKLEIVNLVIQCDPNGLVFEKAEFKQGQGKVDFSGLRVSGGERPQATGAVKIRNLDLEYILPPTLLGLMEGAISGDFQVMGSSNSTDGIGFDGRVVLDGKDVITLRQNIHLLEALSVVDFSNNYHRIDFRDGSFRMKTTRGGMELSDVMLKAANLLTLEGKMTVRQPTVEEIRTELAKGSNIENPSRQNGASQAATGQDASQDDSVFSLKRAGREANRGKDAAPNGKASPLLDITSAGLDPRRPQPLSADQLEQLLNYDGTLRITIPGGAFERARELQTRYPVDAASGRIPMVVPISGHIHELTRKQAGEIYQQGQR